MLPPLTRKYTDLSTPTDFRFRFYCDRCGGYWESVQYPFSQRDEIPANKDQQYAHDLIWMSEHEAAYERANNEAVFWFGYCKKCGKRICDKCYSELGDGCIECEKDAQKGEKG